MSKKRITNGSGFFGNLGSETRYALFAVLFVIISLAYLGCQSIESKFPDKPVQNIYVSDNANMFSNDTKQKIYVAGKDMDDKFGAQVVVVTIDSLDGEDIDAYANLLFREWGIGNAEKNNGVLLLISKSDKKFRIEIGYGLEGAITDGAAGAILDEMKPYFKKQNYNQGVLEAYFKLADNIYHEYENDMPENIVLLLSEDIDLQAKDDLPAEKADNMPVKEDDSTGFLEDILVFLVIGASILVVLWAAWHMFKYTIYALDIFLGLMGISILSGAVEYLFNKNNSNNSNDSNVDTFDSYDSSSDSSDGDYGGGSSGGGGSSDSW